MNRVAIKMLMGDRAKYIGIIVGLTFASLLITQQMGIFIGLMARTYGAMTDLSLPDVWVMDPKVQFVDDVKPLQDTVLYRVRGIDGVEWAVPLYKGLLKARLDNGNFQTCNVLGLDDATLIGGPPIMVEGKISDLRRSEAVIVDQVGAKDKLAKTLEDGTKVPLKIGDTLELNDHRAVVVGLCKVTRTFQSQPVVYTTYSRAVTFAPRERKLLSFVLAKVSPGENVKTVCARITASTGLAAYTREEFQIKTFQYFMKYTGIPINFGIAVALGFIVGTAIAGQTFYNFTLDNLKHFGALKAMGAGNWLLVRMIMLQAAITGAVGYGLGVGAAAVFGYSLKDSELAFKLPWQLLIGSAAAVMLICLMSALVSIRTVVRLEPAIVFKG
ncbi:MAG TPA: ABC transporter permease [Tepidisphaeraceae bacterium]|jgi:putative ABC transport system permease protein|nr:ABC transporter permease [Tepidisphaeraceae bacterium]